MRGLVVALNEQGYGSSSASLRKMSRKILDLLSEVERGLRKGRHSEASIAITDLGDALLALQGEWEFSGMGMLPKVAGSLVSEFPDIRKEFAFLVRLRSTLMGVVKLKRKGIPSASAEKVAAEEVAAALKVLRPTVLRVLKVVEEDEIHEQRRSMSAKSTPADAYKAIGAVLGFEFGRFGAEIEASGIRFTWVDAPGEVVLRAGSKEDAKKLASLLRKGGVLSLTRGTEVFVDTNDMWTKGR